MMFGIKRNQKPAMEKPVEEPVEENRRFRYILLEDKLDMEYEMPEKPPEFCENTAQEILGDSEERKYYKYDRRMHVVAHSGSGKERYAGRGVSLSEEGMIVKVNTAEEVEELEACQRIILLLKLYSGDLPEDFSMNLKVTAVLEKAIYTDEEEILCAFRFKEPLSYYDNQKRASYMVKNSLLFLFGFAVCFLLLYTESIWCLRYDGILYRFSMIVFAFAFARCLFSAMYKPMHMAENYFPKVTVIIPNLKGDGSIQRTVASCRNQRYPMQRMEIMIMHGCRSRGEALLLGARSASGEFLVFAGDGSALHPDAVRQLIQPFQDPYMGAVTGSPRVRNRYVNIYTRFLAMEYFHRFRVRKAGEACFDAVAGISGELCCYRREVILKKKHIKQYRTGYQDSAIVFVNVPDSGEEFVKRQKRVLKGSIKDGFIGLSYVLRKEPFVFLFCYFYKIIYLLFLLMLIYGLIAVPLIYGVMPFVYLITLLVMTVISLGLHVFMAGFLVRKPRPERRKSK